MILPPITNANLLIPLSHSTKDHKGAAQSQLIALSTNYLTDYPLGSDTKQWANAAHEAGRQYKRNVRQSHRDILILKEQDYGEQSKESAAS